MSKDDDEMTALFPEMITLRDYFAAKAMQAIITGSAEGGTVDFDEDAVAENAYKMADAMIKERDL